MTDKFTQDIHDIVDGIFRQKEEVAMRKETEEALNKSAEMIAKLDASLEAKGLELADIEAKNEELKLNVSQLSDKTKELEENLESAKSDFEAKEKELTEQLEAAQAELEDIKMRQLAEARFENLTNEGIAATDKQAVKDQIDKIRVMTEEDFELYKTDRIELRKSIIAELEESATTETVVEEDKADEVVEEVAEEIAEEEAAEEEVAEEEVVAEEGSEETLEVETEVEPEDEEEAAAESGDSIDPMKAVSAMLNLETVLADDILTRYRELGAAMAENVKKDGKK